MTPLWLVHARRHPMRILAGAVFLVAWWAVLLGLLIVISGIVGP